MPVMQSHISWCDSTWNPVTGCTKVSPACDNCYAERFAERWRGIDSRAALDEHPQLVWSLRR